MTAVVVAGCFEEPPAVEEDGSTGDATEEPSGESSGEAVVFGEPQCVDYGEPCTECEMDACGDLFCECYGNPDCGLVAQCVLLCAPGDLACIGGCAAAYPDGTSDSALLADCAVRNCEADCSYLGTLPPPLDACEECVYAECGDETDACFGVANCPSLLVCVGECGGDTVCEGGCGLLYPGALGAAEVVGACSVTHCAEACS